MMHRLELKNQSGFTIPELLTVLAVTTIFTSLILFFGVSFWRYGYLLESDLDTLVTRLNAGDFLRESFNGSSGLIIQNSITDSHSNKPDPAIASNLYWLPLHAIPGNKPIGGSGTYTPLLYYRRYSISTTGTFIMNGVQPYEDEYVLYMNGTTKQLMQRILVNPSATNNKVKTSCPAGYVTASCPADKVIANDIASIDLRYFSKSGNLINYTSSFDTVTNTYTGPDYTAVEVVELNLHLTQKPIFQKTNATVNDTVIRIALRNT